MRSLLGIPNQFRKNEKPADDRDPMQVKNKNNPPEGEQSPCRLMKTGYGNALSVLLQRFYVLETQYRDDFIDLIADDGLISTENPYATIVKDCPSLFE